MYVPEHFRMSDQDLRDFLSVPRAGHLMTVSSSGRPDATFLPWTVVSNDRLTSHIAGVNTQAAHEGEVLVVLMGNDHFVSREWMSPGSAPTWDYESVHLWGEMIAHHDAEWIIQSWDDMLRCCEGTGVAAYDPAWLERMARGVTGIEVRVREVEAKSKLSQNRPAVEIQRIADHMEQWCPHLADRLREVSLPHATAREERVQEVRETWPRPKREAGPVD